jgi:hypothetical protein
MPNRKINYNLLLALLFIIGVVSMAGCNSQAKDDQAKKLIGEKVVVILANEPDKSSNILTLQDYLRDGKSYIPFFSSKSAFDESTNGVDLGKPIYQIDRRLFVNMVRPQEIFVLNVGSKSEMTFTGDELKRIFPEPFDFSK